MQIEFMYLRLRSRDGAYKDIACFVPCYMPNFECVNCDIGILDIQGTQERVL